MKNGALLWGQASLRFTVRYDISHCLRQYPVCAGQLKGNVASHRYDPQRVVRVGFVTCLSLYQMMLHTWLQVDTGFTGSLVIA